MPELVKATSLGDLVCQMHGNRKTNDNALLSDEYSNYLKTVSENDVINLQELSRRYLFSWMNWSPTTR